MDKNVGSQQLDIKLNFQHMSMSFSQPMFRPICWQVSFYLSYLFETNIYKELWGFQQLGEKKIASIK
jgi:hypothetical protein